MRNIIKKYIVETIMLFLGISFITTGLILEMNQHKKSNLEIEEEQEQEIISNVNDEFYLVEFDVKGGSIIEQKKVKAGNYIEMPEPPTKEGFHFLYWQYNDQEYNFSTIVSNNITLTAVWEEIDKEQQKYIVSFETVGGTTIDSITILENTTISALPIPVKQGYVFKNWLLNNQVFDKNMKVTDNITLMADWEQDTINNQNPTTNNNKVDTPNNNNPDNNSDYREPYVTPAPPDLGMHVVSCDDLALDLNATTITFKKYAIDFSKKYDSSYYYQDIDGYEFLRSTTENGNYEAIAKTKDSIYKLENIDVSREYYYAVRAYKTVDGKTVYSDNMRTVYVPKQLEAPTNVFYKTLNNTIVVSFNSSDSRITRYDIFKKTSTGKTSVWSTNSKVTNWVGDASYGCYTVQGFMETGNIEVHGLESKEICFSLITSKVENINTNSSSSDVKVTWDKLVDNDLSYKLDISTHSNSDGRLMGETSVVVKENTYNRTDPSDGTHYSINIYGYRKTDDYEIRGPKTQFYIR